MTNTKGPQAVSAVMQQLRGKGGAPRALTNAERKFLENSTLIQGTAADAKDAAYLARELVQASLPHSNPGDVPLWGVPLISVPKVPLLSLGNCID